MSTVHASIPTVLGDLLVVADDGALIGLYFPGHRYPPDPDSIGQEIDPRSDPVLGETARQLEEYLAGERTGFALELDPRGPAFDRRVWHLLLEIPYGERTTYGALAERLGNPHLAQRVGRAVGHNPISIIIPCHRVVGSDGALTGFAGGLERKAFLLDLEEPETKRANRLF